jgi:hypothetical protein
MSEPKKETVRIVLPPRREGNRFVRFIETHDTLPPNRFKTLIHFNAAATRFQLSIPKPPTLLRLVDRLMPPVPLRPPSIPGRAVCSTAAGWGANAPGAVTYRRPHRRGYREA